MILLNRGAEPEGLEKIRIKELDRVKVIAQTRSPTSDEIGIAYQGMRQILCERQVFKCCFCEFKEGQAYNDVEHYRPKTEVQHSKGGTVRAGYWWLAWTWGNLMFACAACNRSFKRTRFYLDDSSTPLAVFEEPPGQEKPLLINPFEEDPLDHIQFLLTMSDGRQRWLPNARNGSNRGQATIEIVGLDRDDLLDLYDDHIANYVEPHLATIRAAVLLGDPRTISETWRQETKRLLNGRWAFAGLTYDALDAAFPESFRVAHDLDLGRPVLPVPS